MSVGLLYSTSNLIYLLVKLKYHNFFVLWVQNVANNDISLSGMQLNVKLLFVYKFKYSK